MSYLAGRKQPTACMEVPVTWQCWQQLSCRSCSCSLLLLLQGSSSTAGCHCSPQGGKRVLAAALCGAAKHQPEQRHLEECCLTAAVLWRAPLRPNSQHGINRLKKKLHCLFSDALPVMLLLNGPTIWIPLSDRLTSLHTINADQQT